MAIPGYNDLGYPVQPQPDIPVTLQDQRTGSKDHHSHVGQWSHSPARDGLQQWP